MRFLRFVLFSALVGFLPVSTDGFALELAAVSGLNFSNPSLNPGPAVGYSVSTRAAFDFGGLAALPLGGDYVFETGLLRHSRATILESSVSSTESRYSGWLVPLTLRFMRANFFGLGFGPYVAVLDSESSAPNRAGYEVGLRVNLRLAFSVYQTSKVIVDGSYLFGFTDLNKSGIAEDKTQDLLLLVGLQIPFGSESPTSKPSVDAKEEDRK